MSRAVILAAITQINSLNDLTSIKNAIEDRIIYIESENEMDELKTRLMLDGFYVSTREIKIPDVPFLQVKYHMMARSMAKGDLEAGMEIRGNRPTEQDPWVDELEFDYMADTEQRSKDLSDFAGWAGEWEFGDWDDPAYRRCYTNVYIYFRQPTKIPNHLFSAIDRTGSINVYVEQRGHIYEVRGSSDGEKERYTIEEFLSPKCPLFIVPSERSPEPQPQESYTQDDIYPDPPPVDELALLEAMARNINGEIQRIKAHL